MNIAGQQKEDMPDLSSEIDKFNDYFLSKAYKSAEVILTDITHEFIQNLHPISPPGKPHPKFLIHYTSLDTLFSMLDHNNPGYLRLYDTVHSNDPTEGTFFHDCLKSNPLLPKFVLDHSPGYAYISSFVRGYNGSARDKLVYWLAYGRNGYGCSIAIPYPTFSPNLPLLPVQYGNSAVKKTAQQLVNLFNSFTPSALDYFSPSSTPRESRSPLAVLSAVPYFFKPSSYRGEKECRLFLSPLDPFCDAQYQLRYSPGGGPIVRRYIEHAHLKLGGVLQTGTVITLGPSVQNSKNVQEAICALLHYHGLIGPDVVCSKIPYRPPSN